MAAALGDPQADPLALGDLGDEARALESRRAELEVRIAGARERARAEQRAAQVGAAAARAADDALRRALERRARRRQHARLAEELERPRVDVDVQLVARRAVERTTAVGADLGADAEVAQERERAPRGGRAREVEVDPDAPVA